MKRRSLIHHVLHAALLNGIEQLFRFPLGFKSKDRGNGRNDMLAMIQSHDGETRMTRRIGRDVNGFDTLVLNHLFTGRISLLRAHRFGQSSTATGVKIGRGDHFDIGMVLIRECRPKFAEPISCNTDTDLAVRNRLPAFRGVRVVLGFFKARNDFPIGILRGIIGRSHPGHSQKGSGATHSMQESPSGQTGLLVILFFVVHNSCSVNSISSLYTSSPGKFFLNLLRENSGQS